MNNTLRIFDTQSSQLKELKPSDNKKYRFYCCGPTVYGPAHIGNFRTFLIQDVFRRVMELSGIETIHVRNITDVDDKTIRQSQQEGKTLREFTDYWRDYFHIDCKLLNILPPHYEPSAVALIPDQIRLIERLIETGHAYISPDNSVYYNISSFPEYGKLSKLDQDEISTTKESQLEANISDEYSKESLADFALWKSKKPEDGPNSWDSPWGEGRPGWHIECSTMSMKYIGETIDLHSGGIDLIFPHHENEIAQSEGATGKLFSETWFHINHLLVDGHKMSKSLGNLYTLKDIMNKEYTPAELRYVLISGHYRKQLNFTFDSLVAARQALNRISRVRKELQDICSANDSSYEELVKRDNNKENLGRFGYAWEALLDNLNTAKALGFVFTSIHQIENDLLELKIGIDKAKEDLTGLLVFINATGLELPEPLEVEVPDDVKVLADDRLSARNQKDWSKADELRQIIFEKGWIVNDSKDSYDLFPR